MSTQPNRLVAVAYGFLPLLIAAGVLFVLAIVGGKAVQGYEMRQQARALEQRIDSLKRENRRLSQELEYHRSDEYIERVAREELGLVRPGDVAVAIVPSEDRRLASSLLVPTPVPTPRPVDREVAVWQRWLSLFVGRD